LRGQKFQGEKFQGQKFDGQKFQGKKFSSETKLFVGHFYLTKIVKKKIQKKRTS